MTASRRRIVALVVPVLLWTAPGLAQAPTAGAGVTAPDLLEVGRRALEARRFREAVTTLERSAALAPTVDTYLLLGRAYWGEDRAYPLSSARAIAAFQRAIALDKDLASASGRTATEQLAVTALRNERLDEARAAYARLLVGESNPDRVERFQTQIDEIDLDRGVYAPPLHATYNARGELLGPVGPGRMQTNRNFEKGRHTTDPARAERHFRRAIDTDPTMHQAYLNLAQALVAQHRCAEAVPVLEQADHVWQVNNPSRPPYVRALVALVACHLELGHLDLASQSQAALDAIPGQDNFEVLGALRLAVALGRASAALPLLEVVAHDDPENPDVLSALATAFAGVGRHGEAARQLQRALALIPAGHPVLGPRVAPWRALRREWLQKAAAKNKKSPPPDLDARARAVFGGRMSSSAGSGFLGLPERLKGGLVPSRPSRRRRPAA